MSPFDAIAPRGKLELLYTDEHLVAVNKPSGLVVHRGWAADRVTLMSLLRDRLGQHVHPVHRLDRATSGVVLFVLDKALIAQSQARLAHGGGGSSEKLYVGLVRGVFSEPVHLDHPIRRGKHTTERVDAVTDFEPVGVFERFSLIRARPRTGRTHQIRRHLKHLSHPLVGDVNYGKGPINRDFRERFGLHRLALHACSLRLEHPVTGAALCFRAPLPADLNGPFEAMGLPTDLESLAGGGAERAY